jgi:hypothetical protein
MAKPEASPWLRRQKQLETLKGRNKPIASIVLPFQG